MKPAKEKKTYCTECGRKIIKWRENAYKDYKRRKMHRTCWKKKQDKYIIFSPTRFDALTL